ncbi:hypothetical protein TRFO_41361 [Tritrichomonas foetus]|uniref:Uncharacterized protein n=1 Tax=Tritrichomonas foetus TaxID=1144522 RepID=A0A1J4L1Q4_9EUKA|nr:hypothetical protein TRFO_41361 [Tritrichomonas foetus]|eukprot:OHT17000.1 hypothetical protein TRFO_41361 [Tritrichomonas foetus]
MMFALLFFLTLEAEEKKYEYFLYLIKLDDPDYTFISRGDKNDEILKPKTLYVTTNKPNFYVKHNSLTGCSDYTHIDAESPSYMLTQKEAAGSTAQLDRLTITDYYLPEVCRLDTINVDSELKINENEYTYAYELDSKYVEIEQLPSTLRFEKETTLNFYIKNNLTKNCNTTYQKVGSIKSDKTLNVNFTFSEKNVPDQCISKLYYAKIWDYSDSMFLVKAVINGKESNLPLNEHRFEPFTVDFYVTRTGDEQCKNIKLESYTATQDSTKSLFINENLFPEKCKQFYLNIESSVTSPYVDFYAVLGLEYKKIPVYEIIPWEPKQKEYQVVANISNTGCRNHPLSKKFSLQVNNITQTITDKDLPTTCVPYYVDIQSKVDLKNVKLFAEFENEEKELPFQHTHIGSFSVPVYAKNMFIDKCQKTLVTTVEGKLTKSTVTLGNDNITEDCIYQYLVRIKNDITFKYIEIQYSSKEINQINKEIGQNQEISLTSMKPFTVQLVAFSNICGKIDLQTVTVSEKEPEIIVSVNNTMIPDNCRNNYIDLGYPAYCVPSCENNQYLGRTFSEISKELKDLKVEQLHLEITGKSDLKDLDVSVEHSITFSVSDELSGTFISKNVDTLIFLCTNEGSLGDTSKVSLQLKSSGNLKNYGDTEFGYDTPIPPCVLFSKIESLTINYDDLITNYKNSLIPAFCTLQDPIDKVTLKSQKGDIDIKSITTTNISLDDKTFLNLFSYKINEYSENIPKVEECIPKCTDGTPGLEFSDISHKYDNRDIDSMTLTITENANLDELDVSIMNSLILHTKEQTNIIGTYRSKHVDSLVFIDGEADISAANFYVLSSGKLNDYSNSSLNSHKALPSCVLFSQPRSLTIDFGTVDTKVEQYYPAYISYGLLQNVYVQANNGGFDLDNPKIEDYQIDTVSSSRSLSSNSLLNKTKSDGKVTKLISYKLTESSLDHDDDPVNLGVVVGVPVTIVVIIVVVVIVVIVVRKNKKSKVSSHSTDSSQSSVHEDESD